MEGMTAAEARELIRQEEERVSRACLEEMNAVLEKYGRRLVGVPFYTPDGRTDARVDLVQINST